MKLTNQLLVVPTAAALCVLPTNAATLSSSVADWVPPQGALNVLVIVLDDIGTEQLRMYANDPGPAFACELGEVTTTPTPTLDVLRATGVMYSRAYVDPLCSPTRSCILTGRHGLRTGVGSAIDRGATAYTLPNEELFVPELIRDNNTKNYARGAFGKWHLAQVAGRDAHAAENGFETFQGAKGNLDDHYTWRKISAVGGASDGIASSTAVTVSPGANAPSEESYVADVMRRDAATWINAQTRPFFAYVCFNPPHAPFQVPPNTLLSKKTRSKLAALGYEPGERAAATREDQSLDIELRYKGLPLTIPDINSLVADTTEEAAATAGMGAVGRGVYPDRSATIAQGSDVILRLSFNA
jgi:arylsulfatase A-like enzyme